MESQLKGRQNKNKNKIMPKKKARFKKGSPEAKRYMAKLGRMKGR